MNSPRPIVDYAFRDPRSIAAQLRGHGDGAEFDWLQFRDNMLREHPGLDDSEITALYRAARQDRDQTSGNGGLR